jgi:hypothetical protein
MTTPPSLTPWPAGLWPPLRTASSSPRSRANLTTPRDVRRVGDARDRGGPAVHRAREHASRGVVLGIAGGDDLAAEVGGELGGEGHAPEAGSGRTASRCGSPAYRAFG